MTTDSTTVGLTAPMMIIVRGSLLVAAVLLLRGGGTLAQRPNHGHGTPPSLPPGCLPKDDQQDLFCPGDYDYGCFKIPSLLRVPNSTRVLAFIEARKYSCDDEGYVDLLLKTSDDLGETWSRPSLVHSDSTGGPDDPGEWHTIGDALPILDEHTGVVHLVFTRDNTDVLYTRSSRVAQLGHHVVTEDWATIRNISSSAVRDRSKKNFVGTGHAAGVFLPYPRGIGTLLVPCYGGGSNSFVLASEDRGESWHIRSELDAPPNEWVMTFVDPSTPNRLFASLRSSPHRLQAWSEDGGKSWTPTKPAPELPEPISGCEGSVLLHPNGKLYCEAVLLIDRLTIDGWHA